MGGALKEFELEKGRLVSRVSVIHFSVLESSLGNLAADVIENLVKPHLATIDAAIPPLVIPVDLEQSVKIGGLTEGVVVANSGILPWPSGRAGGPINRRLWCFSTRGGPGKPTSGGEAMFGVSPPSWWWLAGLCGTSARAPDLPPPPPPRWRCCAKRMPHSARPPRLWGTASAASWVAAGS
jgi:hypothetical protein